MLTENDETKITNTYQRCTFKAALLFAKSREFVEERDCGQLMACEFSDGLVIAFESGESRPYSEVTPDLDYDPPTAWVKNKNLP